MHDQADELRALVRRHAMGPSAGGSSPRQIVVAGGRSDVGTTTTALNLAISMAQLGRRTMLVDADFRRNDASAALGMADVEGVAQVLSATRSVHEVLRPGPAGLQVLPGAWASAHTADCTQIVQNRLIRQVRDLAPHVEFVVWDIGSERTASARRFWYAADLVLLTTTPDDRAMMDAYAAIKVHLAGDTSVPVHTLVNRAASEAAAHAIHERVARSCQRFLGNEPFAAGMLPEDEQLASGGYSNLARTLRRPQSLFGVRVLELAERLVESLSTEPASPQPWQVEAYATL